MTGWAQAPWRMLEIPAMELHPHPCKRLVLEEPEIVKQGGRFGYGCVQVHHPRILLGRILRLRSHQSLAVRYRAKNHLIIYWMRFESDPAKLWESNIFGKSLHELV